MSGYIRIKQSNHGIKVVFSGARRGGSAHIVGSDYQITVEMVQEVQPRQGEGEGCRATYRSNKVITVSKWCLVVQEGNRRLISSAQITGLQ
jgi:hypothetical protein